MENYLAELFVRDLTKLRDEVKKFKDSDNVWRKEDGISNTAGTLVVHLVGSLNYTIGELIGHNGYVRDRVKEFTAIDVPQDELIVAIEKLIAVVQKSLTDISQQTLDADYPLDVFGKKSTAFYLSNFYGHLNYHLGQVNYLRRMLEG
jgi:hypothetical protein